jgi:hypothetical protein
MSTGVSWVMRRMLLLRYGVSNACELARLCVFAPATYKNLSPPHRCCYATLGNARSRHIGVLARGEQGSCCINAIACTNARV